MKECYLLECAEDLNKIDKLGDDFYLIIMYNGWVRFFIFPSSIFNNTYNIYTNNNEYVKYCDSVVTAVQECYNKLNL